ncbi:response regulator [Myceligenerans xiligouense]|uniref:Response regulator receiver domain-containing protein n=1 Tax=Myceligenerans xiligouense TaxID=253184 RepID=A0A3N4ZFF0_9MICO|nr:response regulator [Myceligenerans xiligouense]RPF19515.1 response regulator receiver domain-containing protein [Myceligenerans xiligouense]
MLADLITSFAALLWPLLVLAALLLLWRPLAALLRRSDLELELGGQRISITQLNDQQNRMIVDLQNQVLSLREQVEALSAGAGVPGGPASGGDDHGAGVPGRLPSPVGSRSVTPGGPPSGTGDRPVVPGGTPSGRSVHGGGGTAARPSSREILWVDDHPENNAIMIDGLQRDGVTVTLARSTSEAMERLKYGDFEAIISDMGRRESGAEVPTAGLTLLRKVRELDPSIPFVIYGSPATMRAHGAAALDAGVTDVTSSQMAVREVLSGAGVLER